MKRVVHCRTRPGGDALDEALAARLNDRLAGNDTDCMQPLWPVIRELAWWSLGTIAVAVSTMWWLV